MRIRINSKIKRRIAHRFVLTAFLLLSIPVICKAETPAKIVSCNNQVLANYDFESNEASKKWIAPYANTPFEIKFGNGAMGSKGFFRTGPSESRWVLIRLNVAVNCKADSWIGFSARKPGGGTFKVMIANQTQHKNCSRAFKLPQDGSWGTFKSRLTWLKIQPGDKLRHIYFDISNRNGQSLYFDLDNVVIANGTPHSQPEATNTIRTNLYPNHLRLEWNAPKSPLGIKQYRVYRGLYSDFPLDDHHLLGAVEKASLDDYRFAHRGVYYYAINAVDFADNEGCNGKRVSINTSEP